MMRFLSLQSNHVTPWALVIIFFMCGLCLRFAVFVEPHTEGDEIIYMALVEQIDSGNGYTLHGSELIQQNLIDRTQYDTRLFYHPPGGIFLFWLFLRLFGYSGFALVQIFSYILFFWSMILLADILDTSKRKTGLILVGALAAFHPFMAHAATNFWLDTPLLAFSTLSAALFLLAASKRNLTLAFVAGILLGYAALIKLTAFTIIPGLVGLLWIVQKPAEVRKKVHLLAAFLIPALLMHIPWLIWQWIEMGSPFPHMAGKPSESLIASNPYVYRLTEVRSSFIYLTLTPRIIWTLFPSILLLVVLWKVKVAKWMGLSLLLWIIAIIGFNMILGYLGYSKLMRYLILITPATILMFSLFMTWSLGILRSGDVQGIRKILSIVVIVIAVVALFMEIAQGIRSSLLINDDMISPFIGGY